MDIGAEERIFRLFRKTINNSFELERNDNIYQLTENKVLYEFVAPSNKCFAFRIDNNESKKIALFHDSPPKGVAKMCDAVFVVSYQGRDYIISVEIKTGNEEEYKKQISNGWRFCEWILNLLRDHRHCSKDAIYLGLLVWRTEKSTDGTKQTLLPKRYEKRGAHNDMIVFEAFDKIISLKTLLESARKIS